MVEVNVQTTTTKRSHIDLSEKDVLKAVRAYVADRIPNGVDAEVELCITSMGLSDGALVSWTEVSER